LDIASKVVFDLVFDLAFSHFLAKVSPKFEGTLTDSKVCIFGKIEDDIKHLKTNFLLN
jgi:hypothetical protein